MPLAKKNREISESFFKNWDLGCSEFPVYSSGSTGNPKEILLSRQAMIWSAQQTRKAFLNEFKNLHQFCCLPLDKVGAIMQLVRSKVWNTNIDVVEPSSNPLLQCKSEATIASFTPMQLFHILEHTASRETLGQFQAVLIGGGELSENLERELLQNYPSIKFIHTFGMTETYSHFAGRILGQDQFTVLPETEIRVNENQCLELRNFCTQHQWLATNDCVKITSSNTFKWIGRSDFVINSGGVKIHLEQVEKEIQEQTGWERHTFYCWYKNDERLGQRLILVTTHMNQFERLKWSSPYFKPTEIMCVSTIPLSTNGKVLRKLPEIE